MSSYSKSDLTFAFATLVEASEIWDNIVYEAHLYDAAHLLVARDEYELVGLDTAVPEVLNPQTHPPTDPAQYSTRAKLWQQEVTMTRDLRIALLRHLAVVLPDVYMDCLADCGGPQHLHALKLPHISSMILAEIAVTNESTQVATLAKLEAEGIDLQNPAPLRALESRVRLLLLDLAKTGFTVPSAELLRRVRGMFLVHTPTNNQLMIGYTAYHTSRTASKVASGTGLLTHMVTLEKRARAQGSPLFDTPLVAAKAAAVPTVTVKTGLPKPAPTTTVAKSKVAAKTDVQALLSDTSLTALQQEVLTHHLQAALAAVNFAGTYPTESKVKSHFCPVHGFNDSHGEQDCNRCKSLKK